MFQLEIRVYYYLHEYIMTMHLEICHALYDDILTFMAKSNNVFAINAQ